MLSVSPIPRYRPQSGPAILAAGFRPFFLASGLWAAVAVPLWLAMFAGRADVQTMLAAQVWHVHEMVFGFGAATVAGFLLTAIPNWTGRLPLQGASLAGLVLTWCAGRAAVLFSGSVGAAAATLIDLAFPVAFLAVVAREIAAGRNWRNLPMVAALSLLLIANSLVHAEAMGVASTADLGNRLGVGTLLMLISLVGGRIIPSFTANWLAKQRPEVPAPGTFGGFDRLALALTAVALLGWVAAPESRAGAWVDLAAAMALAVRLARWRGWAAWREPLLWILHVGYAWLPVGLLLLGASILWPVLPQTTALHALTAGAIGTMTLAVMTRASLGHTGRPLTAGAATTAIYVLVTVAAVARILAPLAGADYFAALSAAGAAWTSAFGLFVIAYARPLTAPRT